MQLWVALVLSMPYSYRLVGGYPLYIFLVLINFSKLISLCVTLILILLNLTVRDPVAGQRCFLPNFWLRLPQLCDHVSFSCNVLCHGFPTNGSSSMECSTRWGGGPFPLLSILFLVWLSWFWRRQRRQSDMTSWGWRPPPLSSWNLLVGFSLLYSVPCCKPTC